MQVEIDRGRSLTVKVCLGSGFRSLIVSLYSSISVYALHPMYLRLSEVEGLSPALKSEVDTKVKEFNDPHYYKEKQW